MSDEFELLVIGGGPAGLSAARAYRDAGGRGAVAIVTDEHRMPYNRPPLTKELLRGESSEDELPIEAEAWLQEHDVRLVCGRAVTLDPASARGDAVGRARASLREAACSRPAPSRPGCPCPAPTTRRCA